MQTCLVELIMSQVWKNLTVFKIKYFVHIYLRKLIQATIVYVSIMTIIKTTLPMKATTLKIKL